MQSVTRTYATHHFAHNANMKLSNVENTITLHIYICKHRYSILKSIWETTCAVILGCSVWVNTEESKRMGSWLQKLRIFSIFFLLQTFRSSVSIDLFSVPLHVFTLISEIIITFICLKFSFILFNVLVLIHF